VAKDIVYDLAQYYDGQDHFYRAALNIACGTDPERRKAILADFDKHFPEWNDKVADLVWELRPASVLPRLSKLLKDPKLTDVQKGRIVEIMAASDDESSGRTLLDLLVVGTPAEIRSKIIEQMRLYLPTKWKGLSKTAGLELWGNTTMLMRAPETRADGIRLAAVVGDERFIEELGKYAFDKNLPLDDRIQAARALGHVRYPNTAQRLSGLIWARKSAEVDPQVRIAAAAALGELSADRDKAVAEAALKELQLDLFVQDAPPELRAAMLAALASSRPGTAWLLKLKEDGKMPEAIAADAARLLRNSPFQGERNKALLLFPAAGKLDPKKLPAPAVLAKRTGDPKRGEKVLAASLKGEAQCLRCHTVNGVGGNIGPDQSMIGKKASKENLFESILFPSKAIADQYVQWKVDTVDGKTVTGLLVAESETSLTLRDANGKDHTFAVKDLDGPKQKSLTSLMPDNLVAALTEDELIDLVEYLLTLKTASLTPDAWHVLGPFANDARDTGLDRAYDVESLKAIDLTTPVKGPNGALRWNTVHVTSTGYLDLMAYHAGKSAMSMSYAYRVIESPADQDAVLLFGNDDGAKVWVSGEKVFENREHLAAEPGRHRIPVKLKKGPNPVLIKIVNGNDPHGFYFALTSEQELKAGR
jgi:putative heme-binding domain-containing protein